MIIEIVEQTDPSRTLYQCKVNGIVIASSFDKKTLEERVYYIKLGADAMLKHINNNISVKIKELE
jgi:uncharacterized protein (DUF427 family)